MSEDDAHQDGVWYAGMCPSGVLGPVIDKLGMWVLDVVHASGCVPTSGVKVELTPPDDMLVAPPAGWVAFTISVPCTERFDADV